MGIVFLVLANGFAGFATGAALLGVGTAMIYPTLRAVTGDVAHPSWRACRERVDLSFAAGDPHAD